MKAKPVSVAITEFPDTMQASTATLNTNSTMVKLPNSHIPRAFAVNALSPAPQSERITQLTIRGSTHSTRPLM